MEAWGRAERRSARPLPDQLRLRRTLEPFPAPDGTLYLLDGAARAEFAISAPEPWQRELIARLGEGVAADGALALGPPGCAREAVGQLHELGLLERAPIDDGGRYARQLLYFADARPERDPHEAQDRLAAAQVVILGCGGLGSWTMCALAAAGVGSLLLVDDDVVELSNLNRQLLYRMADLGRPKVEAAAEALSAFNPELEIRTARRRVRGEADVARLLEGADLLVETADWPPYDISRWVDDACRRAGVAHISAGQMPPLVRVGPLYVPGRTACHRCQETTTRAEFPLADGIERFRRSRGPAPAATLGPASAVIGGILGMEAVHWLAGVAEPATLGHALSIDLGTWEVERAAVRRHPECPGCSGADGP